MRKVLVTGASGNVGSEVAKALGGNADLLVLAGVRDVGSFAPLAPNVEVVHFDFEDRNTFAAALDGCDSLFLLRPPTLADVGEHFAPLIDEAASRRVRHIVFLSVQGVEGNRFIPHYKIEKLIEASGVAYTFLRPAYFMQNFIGPLLNDLRLKDRIFLPAGDALFTLVDVTDVGKAAAAILSAPEPHAGKAYDLTSSDRLTFAQIAEVLSEELGRTINYVSPSPLRFLISKIGEGEPPTYVLVMVMLHYLPRFRAAPPITRHIEALTGKRPRPFREFAKDNRDAWRPAR